MKRERLSIAMCTYNGARYLQEQLDSIRTQQRLPDELVVCDDGSSDGTRPIIEAFAEEASFSVRLFINEKNLGSTRNFEQAIGLCEGDIIFLSDQDDVWLPVKLARIEALMTKAPDAAGAITDAQIVNESLKPLGFCFWQATKFGRGQQKRVMKGELGALLKHFNSSFSGATFAFRTELRDLVLPIPAYWTHDAWIVLMVAALAKLVVLPEPLNLWRQHENQQLGSWSKKGFSEMRELSFRKDISRDAVLAIRQFESARERIDAMDICDQKEKEILAQLLSRLQEKSLHLRARSQMATARIKRLPAIAHELASMRYNRYSSGFKSAARDFFIP